MKKITVLLLLFALILTSTTSAFAQMTPKQIFDKWSTTVVTVETPKGSGTGFFDSNGSLFTAYHVLAGADTATVTFSTGYKETVVRCSKC